MQTLSPSHPKAKAQGTYRGHRERQQRRILDAAFRLFAEHGIDRTTMSEIVGASELRASTVYEYFSNKDEIVWAIFSQVLEEDSTLIRESVDRETTGLGKITALLRFMGEQLVHRQPKVRFMAQFDAMYARDWPVERLLTVEGKFSGGTFDFFRELIREGIADGSLRDDLDPSLTLHAVMNAVVGAQRRFASLGEKVEREYGQPIDRLFQETIRIMLLGLKADTPAVPTTPATRVARSKPLRRQANPSSRKKIK